MAKFKSFTHFLLEIKSVETETHLEVTPDNYRPPNAEKSTIDKRGSGSLIDDDAKVRDILKNPSKNNILHRATRYVKNKLGKSVNLLDHGTTPSSLASQNAIGIAFHIAASNHPEYKKRVFAEYQRQLPDIVRNLGATDYDDFVQKSYGRLTKETADQFDALDHLRSQYHPGNHLNYHHSGELLRDVHLHNNITVFRGGDRHEFMHKVDPESNLNETEKFRLVHDVFGHTILGNQFGPKGEKIAWGLHTKMYTPEAAIAATSETHAQNSFVNYTDANLDIISEMEKIRKEKREAANAGLPTDEHDARLRDIGFKWNYAPQASVALPPEMLKPDYDGKMPEYLKDLVPRDLITPENLDRLARHYNTKSHLHANGGEFDQAGYERDKQRLKENYGHE